MPVPLLSSIAGHESGWKVIGELVTPARFCAVRPRALVRLSGLFHVLCSFSGHFNGGRRLPGSAELLDCRVLLREVPHTSLSFLENSALLGSANPRPPVKLPCRICSMCPATRTFALRCRRNLAVVLPIICLAHAVIAQDAAPSIPTASLSYYDDLRLAAAGNSTSPSPLFSGVTTEPLNNEVMRVSTDDGGTYYLRHLTAMDAITIDSITSEFDSVGAVLLAVHHWNNKVSAVVPEVADVASWCPLKFTVEVFDTASSPRKAAGHLIRDVVPRSKLEWPDPLRPYPTALMGAGRSAVSAPLATLAGVNGLTQVSYGSTSTSFDNKVDVSYHRR